MADATGANVSDVAGDGRGTVASWRPPDRRRTMQLALATIWLLDGVLQLQPFMFTAGSKGFGGMLAGMAGGNPGVVAKTITWNASIVDHHAVATNAGFALVQVLIGFGIAWRRTTKVALASSIVWALGVWWFGEGLGGVLHGAGTPVGGGPGAVLFYAVLAVLLWPADRAGDQPPFVAARAVTEGGARIVWAVVWTGLALLALDGSGRAPGGLQDAIRSLDNGQPGWLAHLDATVAAAAARHGLPVAVALSALCLFIAVGVFLPRAFQRAAVVLAVVLAAAFWVVGENFGMILAGGATDPNSGPLLILLAACYWPAAAVPAAREAEGDAEARAARLPVGALL